MTPVRPYRAALAGYYGFGNLGDELLAEASIEALLRCGVERARIVVLTNTPEETKQRFGTAAVNRWKAGRVSEALGQSETLLLGGGGLFQDSTSLRSCFYYWGLIRLARLRGAVPWALGQSVGPLSTPAGRFLARDALRRCRLVQVRDENSRELCASWGIHAEVGGDPVLTLGEAFREAMRSTDRAAVPPKYLVNLRPCPGDLPRRFARAISAVSPGTGGGSFLGVALADEDEELMLRLMDRGDLPRMRIERIRCLQDVARAWSGAVGAAGMRLHFAVLSALAGTPLVAVPYDPKVRSFAEARNVPLWEEGALPVPRVPCFSSDVSPKFFQGELDAFCRKILS